MAGHRIDKAELAYTDIAACAETRVAAHLGSSSAPGQGTAKAIEVRAERLRRNVRGRAGEVSVLKFLDDQLPTGWAVNDVADFAGTPGDIQVQAEGGAVRAVASLEVKTTTFRQWRDRGRVIERSQLQQADTSMYVWCVTAESFLRDDVHVLGWSYTSTVRATASPVIVQVAPPGSGGRSGVRRSYEAPQLPSRSGVYDYDRDDVGWDEYEEAVVEYQVEPPESPKIDGEGWAPQRLDAAQSLDRQLQRSLMQSPHPWPEGSEPMRMSASDGVADMVRTTAEVEPPETLLRAIAEWCRDCSGGIDSPF